MIIGAAQMFCRPTLEANHSQIVAMIGEAKRDSCDVVVFPEFILDDASGKASADDFEQAMSAVARTARENEINVVYGVRATVIDPGHNRAVVIGRDGSELCSYQKSAEVPQRVMIDDVPCTLAICSDRWFLEHADLACLTQETRVMIDISGGHGGDDGRPNLRFVRYPCWAIRNSAFVVVCNPPHDEPDYNGNAPWGGHSAILDPEGRFLVQAEFDKDRLLVAEIDPDVAHRSNAERRRRHPAFERWWASGQEVLEGRSISESGFVRRSCPEKQLTIAAAQMACGSDVERNTARIGSMMAEASARGADLVVFPALAMTGGHACEDTQGAVDVVRELAAKHSITAVVGLPVNEGGTARCQALVADGDGEILTQYDQVSAGTPFDSGAKPESIWFEDDGVPGVVTIGDDLFWPELTELAAYGGMQFNIHIDYFFGSEEERLVRKQSAINHLSAGVFGVYVNAADPSGLPDPGAPASGGSLLLKRVGGHDIPAPDRVETYLPYHTSVVQSGSREEVLMHMTVTTEPANERPNKRNQNRRSGRGHANWWSWISRGAAVVCGE